MEKTQIIQENFPSFDQFELIKDLSEKGTFIEVPSNEVLLDSGNIIKVIPLVFKGSIKVFREDQYGNEIFLYYIQSGQSCAMTLSSCLKREKSVVKAITQSRTKILAVPVDVVHDFMFKYPSWNNFILQTYSIRFEEIIDVVDHVAFQKMDARLLKYLLDKSALLKSKELAISNTEIAKDLNSSREVISRLLKQLEKRAVLKAARGKIELFDL